MQYMGGTVTVLSPFERDRFSFWDFKEKARFFGDVDKMMLCERDVPLDIGKRCIVTDDDIRDMLAEADKYGSINVYIERSDVENDNEPSVENVKGVENDEGGFVSTDDEGNEETGEDNDMYELDKELEENDLGMGMLYEDVHVLSSLIFDQSLSRKKGLKIKKIEQEKLTVVCVEEGCPWRLYASCDTESGKIKIKTYNDEHRCVASGKNKMLNRKRLIDMFLHKIRDNPLMRAVDMRAEVLDRYNVRLTLPQCRGARQKCLEILNSDQDRQFERLWDYAGELKRSNAGSTVILQCTANVFRRLYICFSALRDGWISSCRPVLHLDGAFLKWNLKREILTAVGRDANDQLFLVAWAIVDVENTKNWKWFIKHVREDLNLGIGEGLTVIIDQQKGLIAAIAKHLPVCEHRMCARHIWANFKKLHNSEEVKKCFWWAAKSYTAHSFQRSMEDLKEISIGAYNDLQKHDPRFWSRVFFSTICKCDCVDNNFSESFNASIREARTKPVVQMLELIRKGIMTSNAKKIEEMDKCEGRLTPKAQKFLDEQKQIACQCTLLKNGRGMFEVAHRYESYVVTLAPVTSCSCRYWELSGIPCCHIISVIWNESKGSTNVENFVNDYWTMEYWKRAYTNVLQPVNGENMWQKTLDVKVVPPPNRKMPGRPSKNARKRDAFESPIKRNKGRTMTCQH